MKKKDKTKNKNKNKSKVETIDKIIFAGFALIIVVFVLIALFAMNVFNFKTRVVDKVTEQLIENQENAAETFVGADMIRQYEEMIGREFLRINKEREDLDTREETLNQRETTLTETEKVVRQNKEEIKKVLDDINGEYQDIEELSKVVENMSPENAAVMLTEVDDLKLVRNVIFNIKDKESAAILENLEPSLAAKIILERYNSRDELEDLLEESDTEESTETTEENQENQGGGEEISAGGSSE